MCMNHYQWHKVLSQKTKSIFMAPWTMGLVIDVALVDKLLLKICAIQRCQSRGIQSRENLKCLNSLCCLNDSKAEKNNLDT